MAAFDALLESDGNKEVAALKEQLAAQEAKVATLEAKLAAQETKLAAQEAKMDKLMKFAHVTSMNLAQVVGGTQQ